MPTSFKMWKVSGRGIRGVYGIDAPYVPAIFGIVGVVAASIGVISRGGGGLIWGIIALVFFAQAALYMHTTLRGKFIVWRRISAAVDLPDCARVLDIGCGRGMAVITVLQQNETATGLGLDLWRTHDQTGNDPDAIRRNAIANGVIDRLYLLTEDMIDMSVPDDEMDFVFAYVSIQNIRHSQDRHKALTEIYRVTKPGGQIRIVDIAHIQQYERVLADLGAADVSVQSLGWNGWFGNPFYACKLVSATKAAA